MTIVACVKVYDGIVLGADSATQIMGKDLQGNITVLKVYQNAQKLFQLQNLPVGILTYGIGNIGKKSIETLLRDFDGAHPTDNNSKHTIEKVTKSLFDFLKNIYDKQFSKIPREKRPIMGLYVAGYSYDSTEGEEWEFLLPRDSKPRKVRERDVFGSSWRGASLPFTRLYFGIDPRITEDLIKSGVDAGKIKQISQKYQSPVVYDGMPVKDAVEFLKFILRTTIGLISFEIGPPSCSEPINIAIISPKEGFNPVENI